MLLLTKDLACMFKLKAADEPVTLDSPLLLFLLLVSLLLHFIPVAGFGMPGGLMTGGLVGCFGTGGQRYILGINE